MPKKPNRKKPKKSPRRRDGTLRKVESHASASATVVAANNLIPRPRHTEYMTVKAVPVFPDGVHHSPKGSPGQYRVLCVLGVPGLSSAVDELRMDELLQSGDSRIQGSPRTVEIGPPDTPDLATIVVDTNSAGRLASLEMLVVASDFSQAEGTAHDYMQVFLSRIAFEADCAVEIRATFISELAIGTTQLGATVIGAVSPLPDISGFGSHPEMRSLYAIYREGLNATSPLYQAISFFKVIEAVRAIGIGRARLAATNGEPAPTDPMSRSVPVAAADTGTDTPWAQARFEPYLGRTFGEVFELTKDPIRNAAAHMLPGRDTLVPDSLPDIQLCREKVPVLHFVARSLIRLEAAIWSEEDGAN